MAYSHSQSETRSQAYWEKQMELFLESDLTKKQFCILHNIKFSTFSYWYDKLLGPDRIAGSVQFLQIPSDLIPADQSSDQAAVQTTTVSVPVPDPSPSASIQPSAIFTLGELRIELSPGAPPEQIQAILRGLRP